MQKNYLDSRYLISAILFLVQFFFAPGKVNAQDTATDWAQPINISRSGSTSETALAVDPSGGLHMVWSDTFDGILAASITAGQLSEPTAVAFPFKQSVPQLETDKKGIIHAVWIEQEGDLFYSKVRAESFLSGGAWEKAKLLGKGVIFTKLSISEGDRLHLVYIRNISDDGLAAGVYYTNSSNSGASWTKSLVIYASEYFRALTQDTASLDISVSVLGEQETVYVGWDNRPRKRVFLTKSEDGGVTWAVPSEIDGPQPDQVIRSPFDIRLFAVASNVFVTWSDNLQSGFTCSQFFQWSPDGGVSWNERITLFQDLVGCGVGTKFFLGANNTLMLSTTIQGVFYLLAWNGEFWSEPQPQSKINTFVDPDTLYALELGCRTIKYKDPYLYLVGCDTVESKDIWLTYRIIGDISNWFPGETTWKTPTLLTNSGVIESPNVLIDSQGNTHLFWIQLDDTQDVPEDRVIYYSVNKGSGFSNPQPIIKPAVGDVRTLSTAIDTNDRVYNVWSGGNTGEIYFSWANSQLASSQFEWSEPIILPSISLLAGSPHIAIDPSGFIYVSYVITINEHRGVYFVYSLDRGVNWYQPIPILDAVSQGWETAGNPHLVLSQSGEIYLLFERKVFSSNKNLQGLYFSKSIDGGQTWSEVTSVVTAPILKNAIQTVGDREVYRVWIQQDGEEMSTYFQGSVNGGETWSDPVTLNLLGETVQDIELLSDSVIGLGLIQATQTLEGDSKLIFWVWNGSQMTVSDSQILGSDDAVHGTRLVSATISKDGLIDIAYTMANVENGQGTGSENLYYTRLRLNPSLVKPENTENGEISPSPTEIPENLPTQTPELPDQGEINTNGTPTSPPLLSGEPDIDPVSSQTSNLILITGGVLISIIAALAIVFFIKQRQ
jgi:hypothetical protein